MTVATLPQSPEAEQATLGAMMLSPGTVAQVMGILSGPTDFYSVNHQEIARSIWALAERNAPIDLLAVSNHLEQTHSGGRSGLDIAGGRRYVADVLNSAATIAHAGYHARVIADKAARRRVIAAATQAAEMAYDEQADVADVIANAESLVFAVGQDIRSHDRDRDEGAQGAVLLGYRDLDRLLGGIMPGDICVVAATTSQGKTALALGVARNVVLGCGGNRCPAPALMFSLEMSRSQITLRLLCAEGGVDGMRCRRGTLTDSDYQRILEGRERWADAPFWVDDERNLSVAQMASRCRRLSSRIGRSLGLVVIDHLQFITYRGKETTRAAEIGAIMKALKSLAGELGCPILLCSHLSRRADAPDAKKPNLSHLKESGSIEQDADVVIFLHGDREHPVREAIVAKARSAELGSAWLNFERRYTRFESFVAPGYSLWGTAS